MDKETLLKIIYDWDMGTADKLATAILEKMKPDWEGTGDVLKEDDELLLSGYINGIYGLPANLIGSRVRITIRRLNRCGLKR